MNTWCITNSTNQRNEESSNSTNERNDVRDEVMSYLTMQHNFGSTSPMKFNIITIHGLTFKFGFGKSRWRVFIRYNSGILIELNGGYQEEPS